MIKMISIVTKLSIILTAVPLSKVQAVYHASKDTVTKDRLTSSTSVDHHNTYVTKSNVNLSQLRRTFVNFEDEMQSDIKSLQCLACQAVSYTFKSLVKPIEPLIIYFGEHVICKGLIKSFGYDTETCPNFIKSQFTDALLPLLVETMPDKQILCTYILQLCNMENYAVIDLNEWIKELLQSKSQDALSNDFIDRQYKTIKPKEKSQLVKLALITDLHMDWDYTPGSNTECSQMLCCRAESGPPASPEKAAQKWGDYHCDIPFITLQSMLKYIREEIQPDAVLWGGDSIAHTMHKDIFRDDVEVLINTTQLITNELKGLNIFPTIGNHDTYPMDQFKIGKQGPLKAHEEWSSSWLHFLDNEESQYTWLNYGYFSKQLTNNTRVISLNSNMCYIYNYYSWATFTDSGNQLEWLIQQLKELEEQNGYAIIMAHVPNMEECSRQYARRYHAIVDRFQHVIRFGMFSHIHVDKFQLMTDIQHGQAIGVNFLIGSATTYVDYHLGKSPSFAVLYLDPETMLPVDLETHAFDLETANEKDIARWSPYMDYRREYNMADLSPASFRKLSEKIRTDKRTCLQYSWNSFAGGPKIDSSEECTQEQQHWLYCQTRASDSDELQQCVDLWRKAKNKFNIDAHKLFVDGINAVQHNWYEPANKFKK